MADKHGFTLVELSIVLVILGLLVGGVLTGQSLIHAAELRSVTTEYNRYVAAVQTFRDKYFALPGDMPNATKYWGTATNCPGTSAQGSTTATTCDGNADGSISSTATSNEVFRFWQHLANAGLIEGSYSGVTSDAGGYVGGSGTSNSPSSRLANGLWQAYSVDNSTGSWSINLDYSNLGNVFLVGGIITNDRPYGSLFSPPDAYNIDLKLDDGNPIQGKVMGKANPACTGVTNGSATTAAYVLTTTAAACFIYFPQAF